MSDTTPGKLYVVSTPIGNLEDITLRALRVLKEANVIAAEDTRHTRKLLSHFDIHTPRVSFHEHSPTAQCDRLVSRLLSGDSVALVSDAGTPGVSDPGFPLVRAAVNAGVTVVPVPGASAVLTALVGSGMPTEGFRFVGFLPRKGSERLNIIRSLVNDVNTLVILEAPTRVSRTIEELAAALGPRPACAARELTKVHEEFIRASLADLPARLPSPIVGEWTLVVAGAQPQDVDQIPKDWLPELRRRIEAGESTRDAARTVSEAYGVARKEAYDAAVSLKRA